MCVCLLFKLSVFAALFRSRTMYRAWLCGMQTLSQTLYSTKRAEDCDGTSQLWAMA